MDTLYRFSVINHQGERQLMWFSVCFLVHQALSEKGPAFEEKKCILREQTVSF